MSGNRYGTIKPARWQFSTARIKKRGGGDIVSRSLLCHWWYSWSWSCHLSTRPLKWETIALHFAESISISLLYKNLNYTNRNGYFNLWLNAKNYYPRKLQKSIPHSILNLAWCKLYVFITKFRCSFLHPRDLTQQNHGIRY